MATLAPTPTPTSTPDGYLALSSGLLRMSDKALASYYCLADGARTPELLCNRGHKLSDDALARLVDGGAGRVLVPEREFVTLGERLLGKTSAVLSDTRLSQAERFSLLLAARTNEVETVQRLLKPVRLIEVCKRIAEDVYDLLHAGKVCPVEMFHAPRFGSRWLVHAANVCCYSVLLGIARGFDDQDDLRRLAVAAMLHDLGQRCDGGKEQVKLSKEERQEQHFSHPQRGFEELLDDSDLDQRQLLVVYQHHESLDGSGFPVGIDQSEICPWAMLVKVVDTFDELTSDAPGGGRLTAEEAFRKLRDESGGAFDTEMVRCWTQVMSRA
ncbi:Cyclic di-GMP phosphodiesterase response regulator RpfG [Posidoniimonas corsicana]|uniref:Cyclic di-GMP phosphodiesterase response regulator RpfG n=1 Tax=Posidoniimonas corsicana TaxID=1938618 RepID=A0A5C5V0G2_9BACT|nr:HD domain-containing phosphohydrolase [Posidoniimonas corsicana]TWT31267.1 Cyclic di-GMP phosphodiesterase response regulator RpfG [Posidoniimonas corsicana]